MTIIRAVCPDCGDVNLSKTDVTIHAGGSGTPTYKFTCPKCGRDVVKPATPEVFALLRSGGVRVIAVPAEALEVHAGPPITLDDLIDLHEWMGAL